MAKQPFSVGFPGAAPPIGYFPKLNHTFRDIGLGRKMWQFQKESCKIVACRRLHVTRSNIKQATLWTTDKQTDILT